MSLALRNVAIIAHVDHGKTTLIDGLFKQCGVMEGRKEISERVMDSGELEKERGITITAKNASFEWSGVKINIVDTPGHADFGGEVERALHMVDGALLLVDAAEGPLPQTRFVLRKALQKNIRIVVVINKVDRPDARIEEVEEKILELFYDMQEGETQTNYKTLYASAKQGWASLDKHEKKPDFSDLLDTILEEVPAPRVELDKPFYLLVTNLSFNTFVGAISIGRIESGEVAANQNLFLIDKNNTRKPFTITSLETFSGLGTTKVQKLEAGNIALIAGIEKPAIGDTITASASGPALTRINVDPPSVSVRISVNTSPLAGTEGEYVTSRKLEELLTRACLTNVALSFENTAAPEIFLFKARGELQINIVLEELRRQGYELMVGRPEVIPVTRDNQLLEPLENIIVDVPQEMVGSVTDLLSRRGGRMESMEPLSGSSRVRLEFGIPARGLIGVRSEMLTKTKGEAIYSSSFKEYIPYQGKRLSRKNGALIADRTGETNQYGLFNLQDRGKLFIREGTKVYEGMIIGEHSRPNDLNVNAIREKKLTNIRAAGKDDSTKLDPIKDMTIDYALEWIDEDEWVEITPENVRIRKSELRSNMRSVVRE